MESIKRAFRNMFKRGKKKQTTTPEPASASTPSPTKINNVPPQSRSQAPQQHQATAVPTSSSDPKPPRLPPLQQNSPLQSATDTSKPLPPTHPLQTGKHDKPQEAVPQNHDARLGPPPGSSTAVAGGPVEHLKEEERQANNVSPLRPASATDGTKSEVSEVEDGEERPPAPPPKTDSGVETGKHEEMIAPVHDESPVVPATQKDNIAPNSGIRTAREEAEEDKPLINGTPASASAPTTLAYDHQQPSAPTAATPATESPAPAHAASEPPQLAYSDDKIALITEEPPPIKTVHAAPGMSATSGPLQDFPEGGFDLRED